MGNRPLTWQGIVITLLVMFGLFPSSVMAFGKNIPPNFRPIGIALLFVCSALIAVLGVWNWKLLNREDLLPDVLVDEIPPSQIFEVGSVHFSVLAGQHHDRVIFQCLVQNLLDGESVFDLRLEADKYPDIVSQQVDHLQLKMSPGEVIQAIHEIAVRPVKHPTTVRWQIRASGRGTGRRVRFARRTAPSKRTNPNLTAALLLVGHLQFGGGTFISVTILPSDASSCPPPLSKSWRHKSVWTPSEEDRLRLSQRI